MPSASPTSEPAVAAFLVPRNDGRATAERTPTMATTIISSTKVKPLAALALLFLSERRMDNLVVGLRELNEVFIGGH
jgi:hypothetical protein